MPIQMAGLSNDGNITNDQSDLVEEWWSAV